MIYITGDIHGDTERLLQIGMLSENGPGKGDFLIVCGDFGLVWYGDERDEEKLKRLSQLDFTILFVDGNHENFSLLDKLPEENRFGGTVGVAAPGIYHLKRGQVYTIESKKIFAMGGAASTDCMLRTEGLDLWERELPSEVEYLIAEENLKRADNTVDIVVSHTAPADIASLLAEPCTRERELGVFLSRVSENVKFNNWYFGHFHADIAFRNGFRCVYRDVVCV